MAAQSDAKRPTAVSVIGWIWVGFGGYLLLRSLFDLVAWRLLAPLHPALMASFPDVAPGLERFSVLLQYITVFHAAKAAFAAFALISAWALLAMRDWGRVAMQVVGAIELAYVVSFAAFWTWLWPRVAAARAGDPEFTRHSYGPIGLVAGIGVCLMLAAVLAAQIVLLRSERARAAFRSNEATAAG